jgi:hypothetical protein
MDWFKKHIDMFITISVIFGMATWMSNKFAKIDERFNRIEQDLAVIKTVLIMKNILPKELAKNKEKL